MRRERNRRMDEERVKNTEAVDDVGEAVPERAEESVIEAEIAVLRSELDGLNNKWMRALADLDNYKKRVERDRRRWAAAAREEIVLDLLEVVDNFERALACQEPAREEPDPFREGVELILKQLRDVLAKHGVVPIVTEGCEFDPTIHEAVGHVESDRCEPNEIVEETQRGYMLGDRPLRCSKVVVAK